MTLSSVIKAVANTTLVKWSFALVLPSYWVNVRYVRLGLRGKFLIHSTKGQKWPLVKVSFVLPVSIASIRLLKSYTSLVSVLLAACAFGGRTFAGFLTMDLPLLGLHPRDIVAQL